MADNKEAFRDSSTQDDSLGTFVTIQTTWSGDTADAAGCFVGIASGSEGSWQFTPQVGGAGAVTAGTQRMTLASDDPAVVSLQLLDNALSGNAFSVVNAGTFSVQVSSVPANQTVNVNLLAGNAPNFGAGAAGTGTLRVFHASDDPAVVALQLLDNAVSGNSFAVTNAGTFAVQVDGTALTRLTDIETNTDSGAVVGNGAAATAQRVTIANDSTGTVAVTNAGTFAVQVDGAALTSLQLLDDVVFSVGEAHTLFSKGFVVSGRDNANSAAYPIPLHNGTHVLVTGASGGLFPVTGNAAHDAVASGNPVLIAGYASAAAPTDVSGDADAVQAWFLRNGAQATVITAGGALIGGDAANGLDVDVTRLPALPAGTNNIGDVDVLTIAAGDNNIGNVDIVTVPTDPFGANADAASATGSISAKLRFIASTGIPITGTVALTANQTVNANLIGGQAPSLNSGTVAAGTLRTTPGSAATATLSAVGDSASSVQLLAANTSRKGVSLHNDSTSILYIKYGTTASATDYTRKLAGAEHWDMPAGTIYNGRIDGIWASDAGGNARITELT